MVGKCYGCGSKDHRKAKGHHKQDIRNYCGLTGHLATVCRKKYFGQTIQKAKVASTSIETSSNSTSRMSDFGAILQQLMERPKVMASQIEVLTKGFQSGNW